MSPRSATNTAESQTGIDYVARVHELGATIVGFSDQIESEQKIPEELLEKIHEAGLFKVLVP